MTLPPPDDGGTGPVVEHLFRHEGAAIVAALARWLGPRHLDLAEEVAQDALVAAMRTWPHHGIPDNPAGWLHRVARNRARDLIRRDTVVMPASADRELRLATAPAHAERSALDDDPALDPDERPGEDRLRLLLLCCHPALPRPAQVALALRLGAGLGSREIARATREPVPTVQQRLVRGRQRLARESLDLTPGDVAARIVTLREVLLAIYGEGYLATDGDLTRDDLIAEAIRLTGLLADHPLGDEPATHALLAMMLLQTARRPARTDQDAGLVALDAQDRGRWDQRALRAGYHHLERSAEGTVISDYHFLAEIAACHAPPLPGTPTDWPRILARYDDLLRRRRSPVLALNRVVALSHVEGIRAAREALDAMRADPRLTGYHLFHATDGDLHHRSGEYAGAAVAFGRAAALTGNDAERAFLERRQREDLALARPLVQSVESGGPMAPQGAVPPVAGRGPA